METPQSRSIAKICSSRAKSYSILGNKVKKRAQQETNKRFAIDEIYFKDYYNCLMGNEQQKTLWY